MSGLPIRVESTLPSSSRPKTRTDKTDKHGEPGFLTLVTDRLDLDAELVSLLPIVIGGRSSFFLSSVNMR
jgi:hypothetical protein